ncbi:MAG: DNA translocase FtsK 4TM domain-containing protein, partial [Acidobacteria bacterium Pan2503]|nr:DNA translocase FtsK 4TM domain-containing protein [Candidatus Acidoferrum panamensis]
MRLLSPTENKRLNELVGFLCISLAVLVALALISYSPRDASFNVSAQPADSGVTNNWMGPVGAYTSDLLFQIFGFSAFLLPLAIAVLGWRWCRSRSLDSQSATLGGYFLLLVSLPSLLALFPFPAVRGALPAGGTVGSLISSELLAGFNFWGALLVAVALFFTSLFMTTRFSFAGTHAWATGPKGPIGAVERLGLLQKAQTRWHSWREHREQQRMRRRVEESRLSGRKPVPPQAISKTALLESGGALANEPEEEEADDKES